jgi:hypothetical protein
MKKVIKALILQVGVPIVFVKIMTKVIPFIFGYVLQKGKVFSQKH